MGVDARNALFTSCVIQLIVFVTNQKPLFSLFNVFSIVFWLAESGDFVVIVVVAGCSDGQSVSRRRKYTLALTEVAEFSSLFRTFIISHPGKLIRTDVC